MCVFDVCVLRRVCGWRPQRVWEKASSRTTERYRITTCAAGQDDIAPQSVGWSVVDAWVRPALGVQAGAKGFGGCQHMLCLNAILTSICVQRPPPPLLCIALSALTNAL